MFHLHRRYLVHKIWKSREISIGDQVSEKTFGILKEAVHSFLAGLDVNSLVHLLKIVTEREAAARLCFNATSSSSSILYKDTRSSIQRQRYLLARVWRWPDLKENHELRHIQCACENRLMGECMCVNPFHLSRIGKRGKNQFTKTTERAPERIVFQR